MKGPLWIPFAVLIMVGAGCGGSKTPTAPTPAPSPAPAPTPTPTPTPTPAPTAATLTGTVSAASGSRIAGATVTISSGPNSGRSATTNSSGDYRFDSLQPGTASLVARALGYQSETRTIDVAGTVSVNFTLPQVPDPFTGTWTGPLETTACSADGNFGQDFCSRFPRLSDVTSPSITSIRLVLRQTGTTVSGDVDFNGSWKVDVRGSITGGVLSVTGTGTIPTQGLTFSLESWDSTLPTATTMAGDFVFRVYATAGSPSGSARYKQKLVNVARTQ